VSGPTFHEDDADGVSRGWEETRTAIEVCVRRGASVCPRRRRDVRRAAAAAAAEVLDVNSAASFFR
jgi:hypothetical protein